MQIKWYCYKWCPHKIQFIADLAVKKLLKSDHFCRSSVPLKINSCYWDILYLLEILEYIWTTKYLKNYQRFQFYGLYVPILDMITKNTWGKANWVILSSLRCYLTPIFVMVPRQMMVSFWSFGDYLSFLKAKKNSAPYDSWLPIIKKERSRTYVCTFLS